MAKEEERRVPRIKDRVVKPYEKPRILNTDRNPDEILYISGQPLPPPKTK